MLDYGAVLQFAAGEEKKVLPPGGYSSSLIQYKCFVFDEPIDVVLFPGTPRAAFKVVRGKYLKPNEPFIGIVTYIDRAALAAGVEVGMTD